VAGVGAYECGQYIGFRKSGDKAVDQVLLSWMQGYLSGMNIARGGSRLKQKELPSPESILAFADKFCADEPLKGMSEAVVAMYFKLNYAD
jgi:hypothetical protein